MGKIEQTSPSFKISDFEDKSLLIVDDDDPLRGRLARALEKKGFVVKDAKTVENAKEMVKTNPPKFALVDLRLEDGSGLDVVKEINQLRKDFGTTFLIATHDENVLKHATRILYLENGKIK